MQLLIRSVLEIARMMILFIIFAWIASKVILGIYNYFEIESLGWLQFLVIFILFFILYRNWLQFHGWYNGRERHKLPRFTTVALLIASFSILLIPLLQQAF